MRLSGQYLTIPKPKHSSRLEALRNKTEGYINNGYGEY